MATTEVKTRSESGPAALWVAFLVGAILVAAVVAAFVFFTNGRLEAPAKSVKIEDNAPKIPEINMPDAPRLPAG